MISNHELSDALDSVITIPLIPFRRGRIDFDAHRKNIRYLMNNNHLSDDRPRVICIAGTSLIHHVSPTQQHELLAVTGEIMQDRGVLISAIVPNPVEQIGSLIAAQSNLNRVPDAYLIMPLSGVYSSQGLYEGLMRIGEEFGPRYDARFLYYHRLTRDEEYVVKLIRNSEAFIGIKVGTQTGDVPSLVEGIGDQGLVIWGIGDRCTDATRLGSKGHTSGISVLYAKAGDLINNALRNEDFATAQAIEKRIDALEELRFMNAREFNYSAVVEAMILSGFTDIDGGEGGPFNPRVPSEISRRVSEAIRDLADLH